MLRVSGNDGCNVGIFFLKNNKTELCFGLPVKVDDLCYLDLLIAHVSLTIAVYKIKGDICVIMDLFPVSDDFQSNA